MTVRESLTQSIGGPLGPRARRRGVWFSPGVFAFGVAFFTMLVAILRQLPCRNTPQDFPNAFVRLCYTDIPTLYLTRDMGKGGGIYSDIALEYPPLIGYMIAATRWFSGLFYNVGPSATHADTVWSAETFFVANAVLLGVLFFALVFVHLRLDSARPWDALFIAASPLVMTSVLINWDLLVVALVAFAIYAWANKRPLLAGVLIGLGVSAKLYPILLLGAILILCLRAEKWRAMVRAVAGAVIGWVFANLPVALAAPEGWKYFWTFNANRGADLGSIWYLLKLIGLDVPKVSTVAFCCMFMLGVGVVVLSLRAPRRPRLAQVTLLLTLIFLMFNTVYSPQYALWLLPLVVLARPKLLDVGVWTAAELVYWFAIWGFLEGILGVGQSAQWVYWMAIIVRILAQLWIGLRVVDDMQRPWDDPVRVGYADDPQGGVLDHAPDSSLFLRAKNAQ